MRDREEGRRRDECLEVDDRHDGVGYGLRGSWLGSHDHVVGVMGRGRRLLRFLIPVDQRLVLLPSKRDAD